MGTYTIWLANEDHGLRFRGVTLMEAADYAHHLRKDRGFEIEEPDGTTTYIGRRMNSTHSTWEPEPAEPADNATNDA